MCCSVNSPMPFQFAKTARKVQQQPVKNRKKAGEGDIQKYLTEIGQLKAQLEVSMVSFFFTSLVFFPVDLILISSIPPFPGEGEDRGVEPGADASSRQLREAVRRWWSPVPG